MNFYIFRVYTLLLLRLQYCTFVLSQSGRIRMSAIQCGVVERKKIISEITTTNHSLLLLPSHHNHVIKHDILIFSLETRHAGECFISVTCQMFHLLLIFISRIFYTTYLLQSLGLYNVLCQEHLSKMYFILHAK